MSQLTCDRCHKVIEGFTDGAGMTAGYYEGGSGSYWAKFMGKEEKRVCDACMWADDRYRAVYGQRHRPAAED